MVHNLCWGRVLSMAHIESQGHHLLPKWSLFEFPPSCMSLSVPPCLWARSQLLKLFTVLRMSFLPSRGFTRIYLLFLLPPTKPDWRWPCALFPLKFSQNNPPGVFYFNSFTASGVKVNNNRCHGLAPQKQTLRWRFGEKGCIGKIPRKTRVRREALD